MSTERGGKMWADGAMRDAKGEIDGRATASAEQLDFLPTPEEMAEAHHALALDTKDGAVPVRDVLAEARRRGRKRGSRNRRTDDFARWILSYGQHPAVTLMQIQSTPPEVLVERSAALDSPKRRLTYGDAQSLITRCADILMPYIEGKKPIAVELGVNGDFNLLIPGLNISESDARRAAQGDFVIDGELVQYLPGDDDEPEDQANG
ncbi:hypothetical protein [Novosphingobium sp. FKTRR1]|uniref:hypothetical protein n=1 Tax=Novosphingobium sp. FKTRR1 TaxID=2879118 RepID=UPI001CF06EAB|nr:hypothetical protein [Novosphingobium sp. FKTRR1]